MKSCYTGFDVWLLPLWFSIHISTTQSFTLSPAYPLRILLSFHQQYDDSSTLSSFSSFTMKVSLGSTLNHQEEFLSNLETMKASSAVIKKRDLWYPTRPQDALLTQYHTVVQGLFLRHVIVETEDLADLAIKMYLKGGIQNHDDTHITTKGPIISDPFTSLAKDLSACHLTKDEGGKVGWIMNPYYNPLLEQRDSKISTTRSMATLSIHSNEAVHSTISEQGIEKLFQQEPKGGDVLKIQVGTNHSRWHICRIDDLLLDYNPRFVSSMDSRPSTNGLGTTLKVPNLMLNQERSTMNEDSSSDHNNNRHAQFYQIITHGCQMNMADSERLEGVLQNQLNLQPVSSSSSNPDLSLLSTSSSSSTTSSVPDVVILNTCSIRDHAEQKVYSALGPYALRKRRGESIAIVVAGCVAQQEGENLLKRVPEVDLVMGPQYVNRLGDLLQDVSRGHQIVATDPTLLSEQDLSRPIRGHKVRAWVNIIHGCNEHCTYCVVPGTRGVEQSRSMEHLLKECLDLASSGYKEITLLGQNIDAYGRDMTPKRTFADLLNYLNENIPSGTIERIRYVTSHPRYFSDRVIDAVASLDKVCECFHMPFQSGDDEILRKMRRGYSFDSYMKIIQKIRDRAPDASISGDVIVGFPGETEGAFQRTLDLMNAVRFDSVNTYTYSPRPNTEAALWENQIPEHIKDERLQIVKRLSTDHALERSKKTLGQVFQVLVEDRNPKNLAQVMGRTRQNRLVFFDGNIEDYLGKLVDVKITEARPWSLSGILIP